MPDGHTTLEDVARKAGVSIATASRALTGKSVGKANREKVEAAARALGYVANQAARSLRNVRTMTVGVVFDQLNSPLATELLDALAMGLKQAVTACSYRRPRDGRIAMTPWFTTIWNGGWTR